MMHPNEVHARSEMEAALCGDFEGMLAHYAEDAVQHYPGRNPLSGTHRGKEGIRQWGTNSKSCWVQEDRLLESCMTSWQVTTM
jgi:ketosteroid isomerase-like protein